MYLRKDSREAYEMRKTGLAPALKTLTQKSLVMVATSLIMLATTFVIVATSLVMVATS